jgi:hypothetical protein
MLLIAVPLQQQEYLCCHDLDTLYHPLQKHGHHRKVILDKRTKYVPFTLVLYGIFT